ncbi:mandelate racemase/muconate lactonizing enzyme family protein [candidate division KSB1 bacterium]|nr:mandelate racemase/muconate lactonizing enzyme family protein [candidate division KSB1 bacterium]
MGTGYLTCRNDAKTDSGKKKNRQAIRITHVDFAVEAEPLIRPFGFKGGYVSELWQTAALVRNENGADFVGLGTQSVLWSDADVFASVSESKGNRLMAAITERALQMVENTSFTNPAALLDSIFTQVYQYGVEITGVKDLRKTFVLNALVAFDNAAWLLYAHENNISAFDDLIPDPYRSAFTYRHKKLASIPLITYGVPIADMEQAARQGYFFMKIKIGQPGNQEEMLEKDKARLAAIHKAIGHIETPHTKDGKIPYYFDANGRYEKKETLLKLLDFLKKIGAYDRIALIEEPFPEESHIDVHDFDVRCAADESAHTDVETQQRIQMGYKAIALKPIAKTLSMSMKIAHVAFENNVPCLCADLTVNPILVDWNKNVAARLAPFPGLDLGLLETNGHQNYKNWKKMQSYHPCHDASWMAAQHGLIHLDEEFYQKSGGIFLPSEHYHGLFR